MKEIAVQKDMCTGCGACVGVCPVGAIVLTNSVASIAQDRCTGCGACVEACPNGALVAVETLPATVMPRSVGVVQTEAAPIALSSRAAKALPVLGGALTFLGQEVLPWLAPRLGDLLRLRERQPGAARPTGGGRRLRRRERRGRP
ncbi:MAG: DUF362 domain-containing protein [Anaerolineae bacterium]